MRKYELSWIVLESLSSLPIAVSTKKLSEWLYQEFSNNWASTESCRISIYYSLQFLNGIGLVEVLPNIFQPRQVLYKISNAGRDVLKLRRGYELAPIEGMQQPSQST